MSDIDHVAFYERRANQERLAAERATHPESRRIHLQLAAAYAEIAGRAQPAGQPILQVIAA